MCVDGSKLAAFTEPKPRTKCIGSRDIDIAEHARRFQVAIGI
jgi:hypothetical protein